MSSCENQDMYILHVQYIFVKILLNFWRVIQ